MIIDSYIIYDPKNFIGKSLLQINNSLYDKSISEYYYLELNSKWSIDYEYVIYLEALLEGKKHGFLLKEPHCAPAYLMYTLYTSNGKKTIFKYYYDDIDFIKESLEDFNLSYADNRTL